MLRQNPHSGFCCRWYVLESEGGSKVNKIQGSRQRKGNMVFLTLTGSYQIASSVSLCDKRLWHLSPQTLRGSPHVCHRQ
jgi:hypothetical protein